MCYEVVQEEPDQQQKYVFGRGTADGDGLEPPLLCGVARNVLLLLNLTPYLDKEKMTHLSHLG